MNVMCWEKEVILGRRVLGFSAWVRKPRAYCVQWRNCLAPPSTPPANHLSYLSILSTTKIPHRWYFPMPSRNINAAAALEPIRNVVSASFLYPFKGILYFCAHREYWPLFGRRLIPLTILSVVVLALLFTFAYLPQAAFLLIFHGPTAWISAVFLVLGEGQIIIALLFEGFLVDETLVDVFDVCHTLFSTLPWDICHSQHIPLVWNFLIWWYRQPWSEKVKSPLCLPPESSITMHPRPWRCLGNLPLLPSTRPSLSARSRNLYSSSHSIWYLWLVYLSFWCLRAREQALYIIGGGSSWGDWPRRRGITI